ncbi:DUF3696 domain-containing protein [Runella aurantiaca]|nr:DUF3696 domain-containing protein [Runella aurantiaca]
MNTHLKGFGLENFRVFKDYTWFDFAPITVLTGTNSSGKSSLIKALLLLENSISKPGQLKLEFSNDNVYQLGNFERIINNKSSDNTVSFHFPYQLQHFPTLGDSYECQVSVTFRKEDDSDAATVANFSILVKNTPLLIYGDNKLWFYFDIFLSEVFLKLNEFKINEYKKMRVPLLDPFKDSNELKKKDIVDSITFLLLKKLDNFSAKTKEQSFKDFAASLRGVDKGYSEIIEKKTKQELEEILDLYQKKIQLKKGSPDTELTTKIYSTTYNPELEEEVVEFMDVHEDDNPLRTILRTYGLSDSLIEFIDLEVLGFSNRFLKGEWLNELQKIQYQPAVRGKVNRIYRKEEKDVLNELITAFFEKKVPEKNIDFLQKWSARFNLLGEIKPFLDSKYNVQSIEIGDSPLVEQGLGISQLVALLLTIITKEDNKKVFIFEEPEANLHPKFQSQLADMFIDAAKTFNIQFIIETHSEYLIRKLQYLIAKSAALPEPQVKDDDRDKITPDDIFMGKKELKRFKRAEPKMKKEDLNIYYFHDPNNVPAGEPQVKKIEILEDGSLSSDFGTGFFDEATNWKFELMRLKNAQKN